ncbi:MAG: Strongly similar to peroxiredoxin (Thioredoxin peroxidase) [uncultured bacterium]|nr:MAG: Strongly similar to peroxiredoxin (Thioredoxin peroxidase) [uncultured bacterium]OGJ46971.1 MAG: thioredoxin peroxidase [Candidatus Peregrinibacteria bacterium RIFOXYA2_FULL_41_18]OGJ49389.1 MAG: thioredoxin peroxidase [Candidatus Peregrinibacteria bacterium RIFOXYB12_FULL_41_12]OGJ53601.1 MAG: thioredoxin peroxidase [Candidatus Peregrinibacteria bacterium RIFOXYC2_FULL_41_22]OGJ54060.1 MAG: thioredoxin peroxidase [Candidatus Peregrinibacteria bacterium RIFOXYB2_FULL_41_88]
MSNIKIGSQAPTFQMEGYHKGEKKNYSLADYKGKWVVLFFYPLDFTFVCPTELIELSKKSAEFESSNAQILGVSVDSVYSHEAWSKKDLGDLNYPLLSDLTKKVSADYGVLMEDKGISLRGAFIIDPDGFLKSYIVNDVTIGRNVEELLRLVKAFQTGDLCPVGWKPGDKTLGKA